jgi:hypothetical protein
MWGALRFMAPFTDRIIVYVDVYSSGVSVVLNGYDVNKHTSL